MAVIVPILMYVSGASAAIGTAIGLSATAVSSIAGLALQVTGVNDKINKAAGKVFGEDFVKIANIAGAVYGAVATLGSAAGAASAAESVATAGEAIGKAALDGTASFGANSMAGALDLAGGAADAASSVGTGLSMAGETLGKAALDGTNALGANSVANSFNLADMAPTTPDVAKGVNLLDQGSTLGQDAKALTDAGRVADSSVAVTGAAAAPQTSAASQVAAAPVTAPVTPNAATTDAAALRAAARVTGTSAVDAAGKAAATTQPGSFFDKLLSNDKATGALIQGVGGAISSAANSKSQKEALEFAKRKYTAVSGVRVA